jgi:replicative DNA helicase
VILPKESLDEEILRRAQRQQQRDQEGRSHLRLVGDGGLVQFGDAIDPWEHDERRFCLGVGNFDRSLQPRRAGDFLVVGALPGAGKTSLLEQGAVANARLGHKVLVVSLEMLCADLQGKMIGRELRVGAAEFERQRREGTAAYLQAQAALSALPLKFFRPPDGKQATIQQIFAKAEQWGADMIALDYAAKIGGWVPGNTAREIVAYASGRTKATGIFLLMLAQLDQRILLRKDRRPTLADFEDTKALSKEATSVVLIHRPFMGNSKLDTVAELICCKNRKYAPSFRAHTYWGAETTTFYAMTEEEECNALCCRPKPRSQRKKAEPVLERGDDEMTRAEEDALLDEARTLFS